MSTNKRKDTAALFELIDKSTLKIPKDSKGAMKIPAWFSSKINPPGQVEGVAPIAEGVESGSGEGLDENDPMLPSIDEVRAAQVRVTPEHKAPLFAEGAAAPEVAKGEPAAVVNQPAVTVRGVTPPEAMKQAKAFDVGKPAAMPEIKRTPVNMPGRQNSLKSALAGANTGGGDNTGTTGGGSRRGTFNPVQRTQMPGRFGHPGMLARTSRWMLAGVGVGALVVLVGLGLGIRAIFGHKPAVTTTTELIKTERQETGIKIPTGGDKPEGERTTVSNDKGKSTPVVSSGNQGDGKTGGGSEVTADTVKKAEVPAIIPGKVLPSGSVKRLPNTYYLLIMSSPTERIARANAEFLVKNGMSDITIEQRNNGVFIVVSVQGFAKISDPQADALRKLVVEIGKKHPDAKRQQHSVFYDAYMTKLVKTK